MARTGTRSGSKKRANGEGTITQRSDGRWQAAVYQLDGKRKFLYAATREEAHDKLVNAQKAVMGGLPIPDERTTVGEYLDTWLKNMKALGTGRFRIEISNPVQTKIHRFSGSRAARLVVGQPNSTIQPETWVRDGKIVIVNTAKGTLGDEAAALVGATLLNLVALQVAEQASLPAERRKSVTMLVDEFHTMPGANYEAILAELAKYGANLILATQSLAQLDAQDRQFERNLRPTLFGNLDGLFVFQTSAEDARYLVRELGEGVDENDIINQGEHQCYVRLSAGPEPLPTFSVHLDPPPDGDSVVAQELADLSAESYGRHAEKVERQLNADTGSLDSQDDNGGSEPSGPDPLLG